MGDAEEGNRTSSREVKIERWRDRAALIVSSISLAAIVLGGAYFYGRLSHLHGWFPEPLIRQAFELRDRMSGKLPKDLVAVAPGPAVSIAEEAAMSPGLTLISSMTADHRIEIAIIDAQGRRLHRWPADWFKVWPDARHVPADLMPKQQPGTEVAGFHLAANGDLTYNFEDLGMVQMDICGRVKWRVPRLTHHTVFQDEAGNFWAPAFIDHHKTDPRFPNHLPPFREYTVIEVSPAGKVMREIAIRDVLERNGLRGVMYLDTRDTWTTFVSGDPLHLNDVEVFPSTLAPGLVKPGDLMVSLRNSNLVLIFDPRTLALRTSIRDAFIRQHDPDFVDGNHITVFDNNDISGERHGAQSRILEIDLVSGAVRTAFSGTAERPFYSRYLGRDQALPNGNRLVVEATEGRMIELGADGRTVWDFRNRVGRTLAGQLFDAQRIDPEVMNPAKLSTLTKACH